MQLQDTKRFLLEELNKEWNLAPKGYRYSRETKRKGVLEEHGLNSTISPQRLLSWCRETGLTLNQISPILEDFRFKKLIRSFEIFDGQWTEDDEPETALHLEFDPAFIERFNVLNRLLSKEAVVNKESTSLKPRGAKVPVESLLSKIIWFVFIPILVAVVAGYILHRMGWV